MLPIFLDLEKIAEVSKKKKKMEKIAVFFFFNKYFTILVSIEVSVPCNLK